MLSNKNDLRLRAAVRTVLFLIIVAASLAFFYLLARIGALPGFLILLAVYGVFLIYDTNKSMIQYEDKLNEIIKRKESN
jgi:hypothetical protein